MIIAQTGTSALLVDPGGYSTSPRQLLVALAARHAIPAMYTTRDSRHHRRSNQLRHKLYRCLSASRRLRRSDSKGRQARSSPPSVSW